ncbi:MAG: dioxygenase [Geobacteraceae bacterium]|nr:dioxygenase [Geobacteraceae bacterium]
MSAKFPALFVPHGAPTLIIDDCPTRSFLMGLGKEIGRPKGIVCISAHWTTAEPRVTMNPQPSTIYDFGGFPDELYSLKYPAPGSPVLAKQVQTLLQKRGMTCDSDMARGYDHGAWVPLMLIYPDAEIPVIQLSVQPHLSVQHHLDMGKALQPLRDEGVLILASGSATHNLRDFFGRRLDDPILPYAQEFAEWLKSAVQEGRTDELLDYVNRGPHASLNHPTPEHFLPLFVALGSGGKGRILHDAYTYGILSMAAFSWE